MLTTESDTEKMAGSDNKTKVKGSGLSKVFAVLRKDEQTIKEADEDQRDQLLLQLRLLIQNELLLYGNEHA